MVKTTYSVWIYGPKIGWWLQDEGYTDVPDATAALTEAIESGSDDWAGGAVLPDGPFPADYRSTSH